MGPRGANNASGATSVPTQKRTRTIKVDQIRPPTPGAQQEQPGSFTAALNDAMAGLPVMHRLASCINLHRALTQQVTLLCCVLKGLKAAACRSCR